MLWKQALTSVNEYNPWLVAFLSIFLANKDQSHRPVSNEFLGNKYNVAMNPGIKINKSNKSKVKNPTN